jgi:hypothetical protein
MYSSVSRNADYIGRLSDFIRQEYQINPDSVMPAKRGYYGETWKLEAADDVRYFIKIVCAAEHQPIYERSFPVIQHLCDHGIDFISKIKQTKDGKLSTKFEGAVLGIFDWIDGENIENDDTKIPEYQMLAMVYTVPACGVSISRETFSTKHAVKFFEQWSLSDDKQLLLLFEKHRAKIQHRAERLRKFAELCESDTSDFVITHGDAGGNFMTSGERNYIVDWDNPLLAPPERDAWVMCGNDWARNAFNEALRRNGIAYTLQPKRLAYYCYDFFFYYLTAFLDASAQADTVEEYIDGWINRSFEYADKVGTRSESFIP